MSINGIDKIGLNILKSSSRIDSVTNSILDGFIDNYVEPSVIICIKSFTII